MSYNPKAQQENGNRKLAGCLLYFWPWTNIDFFWRRLLRYHLVFFFHLFFWSPKNPRLTTPIMMTHLLSYPNKKPFKNFLSLCRFGSA